MSRTSASVADKGVGELSEKERCLQRAVWQLTERKVDRPPSQPVVAWSAGDICMKSEQRDRGRGRGPNRTRDGRVAKVTCRWKDEVGYIDRT